MLMTHELAQSLLAQSTTGPVPLWVYILVLALIILAFVLPRKLARRSPVLTRQNLNETDRLKKSMDDLLIQLQEVSRDVNATLDTKILTLNQLIDDAQARIDELNDLLRKLPDVPRNTDADRLPERETPAASERTSLRQQQQDAVLQLAAQGKSDLEISRETGIPRGEIELLLALRRKSPTR
jgi:hypothetical protein